MKILYVANSTTAFRIGRLIYYIKIGRDLPELYDSELKRIQTPNIDYWLQAQTNRQYSFQSLKHMIDAYVDGCQSNSSNIDIQQVVNIVYDEMLKSIFRSEYTRFFVNLYKIELMSVKQIEKLISKIKEDFYKLEENMPTEALHVYLCRLYQYCKLHLPDKVNIIENFIQRLNLEPQEVELGDSELDNQIRIELELVVLEHCEDSVSQEHLKIVQNAHQIHNSVLARR